MSKGVGRTNHTTRQIHEAALKKPGFLLVMQILIACTAVSVSEAQTSRTPRAFDTGQHLASGAYVGLQGGGQFTVSHVSGATDGSVVTTNGLERKGLVGGIQFGYGREVRRLYLGGEGDSSFGRFLSGHIQATDGGGLSSAYTAHRKFVGTVRARSGFLFGRWLVYGTGGLAIGGLEQDLSFLGPAAVDLTQTKVENEGVELGYAVGGGAEYRSTLRFSYGVRSVYYRFQNQTLNLSAVGPGYHGANPTLHDSGSVLSVGANYHF